MGDAVEVGSRTELVHFLDSLHRLKDADPLSRLLLFVHGNHESFGQNGFMTSGADFQGAPQALLDIGPSPEEFRRDFHAAEVGAENVLDKKTTIEMIYREMFGKDPEPVRMIRFDRSYYTLEGETELRSFGNSSEVFRNLWKQTTDKTWNAIVNYTGTSDIRVEKAWFQVAAAKIEDFHTSQGDVPVYAIALDTTDFLEDDMKRGALEGHVSSVQVKVIRALMDHLVFENPDTKFIFVSHYQAAHGSMEQVTGDGIAHLKKSGLAGLLSDEKVIAFVAAHDHRPNYVDLSKHPAVSRKTPLPGVTVASVIDSGGKLRMTYGVDEKKSEKAYFEFRFLKLDTAKLPGNSPAVCRELQALDPYLLLHDDAIAHIEDPLIREMAASQVSIPKKAFLSFNLDHGLANRPESLPELIVAEDVVVASIEENSFYMRAFLSAIRLSLKGMRSLPEAAAFETSYLNSVELLEKYSKGDLTAGSSLNDAFKALDESIGKLQVAGSKANASVPRALINARVFLNDYRGWIRDYRKLRSDNAPLKTFMTMKRPNGFASFRALVDFVEKAPPGSEVASLMAQITQRAAKQRMQFYKERKVLDGILPEGVIDAEGLRHHVRIVLGEPKGVPSGETCAAQKDYAEEGRKLVADAVVPYEGKPEWHGSLRLGLGNRGGTVEAGAQAHVLNRWNQPRLNLRLYGGLARGAENEYDVYGKVALSLGDPLGFADIGLFAKGGWNVSESAASSFSPSLGVELNLLEGALGFSTNREGSDRGWNGMVMMDLAALERNKPILKRSVPVLKSLWK